MEQAWSRGGRGARQVTVGSWFATWDGCAEHCLGHLASGVSIASVDTWLLSHVSLSPALAKVSCFSLCRAGPYDQCNREGSRGGGMGSVPAVPLSAFSAPGAFPFGRRSPVPREADIPAVGTCRLILLRCAMIYGACPLSRWCHSSGVVRWAAGGAQPLAPCRFASIVGAHPLAHYNLAPWYTVGGGEGSAAAALSSAALPAASAMLSPSQRLAATCYGISWRSGSCCLVYRVQGHD